MTEPAKHAVPALVQNPLDQLTRRWCLGLSAAAFIISAWVGIGQLREPKPPVFISVSVKSLLEEQMLSGLGRDLPDGELERRSADYIRALEAVLAGYAEDETVILVASEAVLGETVPDFTETVRLEAYALAVELAARRGEHLPALGDTSAADALIEQMTAETAALRGELEP